MKLIVYVFLKYATFEALLIAKVYLKKLHSKSWRHSLGKNVIVNYVKNADYGRYESLRTTLSKSEEKFEKQSRT